MINQRKKQSYFGYESKYANISNYFNDNGLRLYQTTRYHDQIFVNEDRVIAHIIRMNDNVKNDMMKEIYDYMVKQRRIEGDFGAGIRNIIDKFL